MGKWPGAGGGGGGGRERDWRGWWQKSSVETAIVDTRGKAPSLSSSVADVTDLSRHCGLPPPPSPLPQHPLPPDKRLLRPQIYVLFDPYVITPLPIPPPPLPVRSLLALTSMQHDCYAGVTLVQAVPGQLSLRQEAAL